VVALAKAVTHGEKICHLHLFHGEMHELALVVLSKLCRRKVIITVHDVESFSPVAAGRNIISKVYQLADRLVVHNQVSKRELVELRRVSPTRIDVIPSGNYINDAFERSNPVEARRTLGISETKRVILFFGQIKDVKGLDILIEAIPAVARESSDVTLLIAGRPWKNDFSLYERLIDNLGIRNRCALHIRYIPNEELALYFAAADVVVLPYRRIYQSAVILMAMSYGRAVVVSDLPGMTEMVSDGQNGYVFEQGSAKSLSEQLIRALQDEQMREAVALRALEYIRKNHDWEQIGKQTAMLYRAVLSN
jgi:glycosyltransferase involved in cell wall biosynthesis